MITYRSTPEDTRASIYELEELGQSLDGAVQRRALARATWRWRTAYEPLSNAARTTAWRAAWFKHFGLIPKHRGQK